MDKTICMKVDFLLCYEFWQRELYGLTQLRLRLEDMGYHVKLLRIHPQMRFHDYLEEYLYKPKVIVFPWVYSNVELKRARSFLGDCQKIVNMQCEQVLSKRVLDNGFFKVREEAVKAFHVSWGENTYNRFIQYGIEKEHIWNIGNINMEINEKRYDECFKSRAELAKAYGLDPHKKWFLFCSNFKLVNIPLRELMSLEKRSSNIKVLSVVMKKSREAVLSWMTEYLDGHRDTEIIYRPHPTEKQDSRLLQLQKKYRGFNYIPDLTVNQWIRVCERCATWKSTAVMDAVYVGKPSAFLTPFQGPEILNGDMDHICGNIADYREFEEFLNGEKTEVWKEDRTVFEQMCRTEENSIGRLAEKLDWLYKKGDIHYFENDMSGHMAWRKRSLHDKKKLIVYWIARHTRLRLENQQDNSLCKELYEDAKREKEIYKNMLKAQKGK